MVQPPRCGFSLIELLVATSLLSIVVVGGFFAMNAIQIGYYQQASTTQQINLARAEADRVFAAFNDNSSFTPPQTLEHSRLTPLWGNNGWLNDDATPACPITAIDSTAPSFTIAADCHDTLGVTVAALTLLTQLPLPSVIIDGASHPCSITAITSLDNAPDNATVLTTANAECLSAADGAALTSQGVIFPRFIMMGEGVAESLKSAYFAPLGGVYSGSGLGFANGDGWYDNATGQFAITSAEASDNFTNAWVNVTGFNGTNALNLINPQAVERFSVTVEALSADTSLATSIIGANAATSLSRQGFGEADLMRFLDSVFISRSSVGDAVLRFSLGSGDFIWQRDLRLTAN